MAEESLAHMAVSPLLVGPQVLHLSWVICMIQQLLLIAVRKMWTCVRRARRTHVLEWGLHHDMFLTLSINHTVYTIAQHGYERPQDVLMELLQM